MAASTVAATSTGDHLILADVSDTNVDLREYTDLRKLTLQNCIVNSLHFPPNLESLTIHECTIRNYANKLPETLNTLVLYKIDSRSLFLSNVNDSDLSDLSYIKNLKQLKVFEITEIPKLPNTLEEIHFSFSSAPLPDSLIGFHKLRVFSLQKYNINKLPELPDTLQSLSCIDCPIQELPPRLPLQLKTLIMDNCELTRLPPFPKTLTYIDVHNNKLTSLPEIPKSVQFLQMCGNPIMYYPYIYRTDITVNYDYNKFAAAFEYSTFRINGVNVFTPIHMLQDYLDHTDRQSNIFMSDMFDDDAVNLTMLLSLQIMCEIQNQLRCREFIKTCKEELMIRTWHPSRIIDWCGVDFTSADD